MVEKDMVDVAGSEGVQVSKRRQRTCNPRETPFVHHRMLESRTSTRQAA